MPWHQDQWQRLLTQQDAGRVPHALLLRGPTGVGKARFGRYLANSRLCMAPGEQGQPCGQCRACVQFQSGSHPDFRGVEAEDGKRVIAVDRIRGVIDWLTKRPHYPGPKLLLFPAADQMNIASANALLKTLEEPAGDTLILLVTARPAGLPATIRSRCQALTLPAPERGQALTWLLAWVQGQGQAGVEGMSEETVSMALDLAGGAPLAAMTLLQEGLVASFSTLFDDIAGVAGGAKDPVEVAERWYKQDNSRVINWMLEGVQAMIHSKLSGLPGRLANLGPLAGVSETLSLFGHLDRLTTALAQMNAGMNPNKQLLMESLFIPWQTGRPLGGSLRRSRGSRR
jgi:DNA polymerase-3 subunit delta'